MHSRKSITSWSQWKEDRMTKNTPEPKNSRNFFENRNQSKKPNCKWQCRTHFGNDAWGNSYCVCFYWLHLLIFNIKHKNPLNYGFLLLLKSLSQCINGTVEKKRKVCSWKRQWCLIPLGNVWSCQIISKSRISIHLRQCQAKAAQRSIDIFSYCWNSTSSYCRWTIYKK